MKEITYFYLDHCPYCKNANKAIDELAKENTAYADLKIERIEESRQPEVADRYDYYHVPAMFIDGEKQYEADPSQGYEEIKKDVQRVFDLALTGE